ncbi:phage integrase N-terminal SAM-like domain-containing protein [Streptomyces sp. NPDC059649]|uniref:phage integrase N-terminal SAM-like domain-containing protein n=1 Tax=Streptomyces sp. NPDC059649 TaxID=3346895 RepID=UPI0036C732CC
MAADWIGRYPSVNTQRSYIRSFRVLVNFARQCGIHPLELGQEHAQQFAMHLATLARRDGKQFSATTRQLILSAASTFYQHWYLLREDFRTENPFASVPRPRS